VAVEDRQVQAGRRLPRAVHLARYLAAAARLKGAVPEHQAMVMAEEAHLPLVRQVAVAPRLRTA
tara:strand:- start:227 stop:418 length:192 start_codon:yes stop_codon:yes gene_type:complete